MKRMWKGNLRQAEVVKGRGCAEGVFVRCTGDQSSCGMFSRVVVGRHFAAHASVTERLTNSYR